jgi:hypothetical protein
MCRNARNAFVGKILMRNYLQNFVFYFAYFVKKNMRFLVTDTAILGVGSPILIGGYEVRNRSLANLFPVTVLKNFPIMSSTFSGSLENPSSSILTNPSAS